MLMLLSIYGPKTFFLNGIAQKFLAGVKGSWNEFLGDFLRRAEVMKVYKAYPDWASHCWHLAVPGVRDL